MRQLTVKPIEHTNVRGKKLYYLSIYSGVGEPYVINVGEGTYNECIRMQKDAEAQIEMSIGIENEVDRGAKDTASEPKTSKDGTKGHVQDKDYKG